MFAKLTNQVTSRTIYVNPEYVESIESDVHERTFVWLSHSNRSLEVAESAERAHAIISEAASSSAGRKE